ncbi:MAG: LysE family translocator [Hyphomonadaceae bacterium]
MIEPAALLAWSALSVGLALTPGADTALVATNAARGGLGTGLRTVAGVVSGGAFYAALFGFGLMRLIAATPTLFMVVKIAGALYLAFLGVQMIRSALKPSVSQAAAVTPAGAAHPWRQGFLCNALNPKVAIFFLAALPQFVEAGSSAPLVGAMLIAIAYSIGAVWLSGIAVAASRVGQMFRASAVARWIEGAVGAAFLALAGRLAIERA